LYSVICGILSTYYAALYRLLEFSGSREKERGNDLVDGVKLSVNYCHGSAFNIFLPNPYVQGAFRPHFAAETDLRPRDFF
jgi:hypothetical protein